MRNPHDRERAMRWLLRQLRRLRSDRDALRGANTTLQDAVAALRSTNGALQDTNTTLERERGLLQRAGLTLRGENTALRQENESLRAVCGTLRQERQALLQERDELLERLREKAVHDAQQRGELFDDDRRAHRELIGQYRSLVELRLPQVAGEVFRFPRRERDLLKLRRLEARAVRLLCHVLFERPGDFPTTAAALAWLRRHDLAEPAKPPYPLFEELRADAARLRAAMAGNAYPAVFGAGAPVGELVAGQTARLWPACAPDGLIEFVVAPAYLVEGGPDGVPWVFMGAEAA